MLCGRKFALPVSSQCPKLVTKCCGKLMLHTLTYEIFRCSSFWLLDDVNEQVNCNARTTCTNSSGVKPDLGLDQDLA